MFVGRQHELRQLGTLREKAIASFVVITGRRRIGKSRLVREFAKGWPRFLEFSGLPPQKGVGTREQQLEFLRQLTAQCGVPPVDTRDWGQIFQYLAMQVSHGEVVVLLDELSWIAMDDPLMLAKLKAAWDLYFSRNPKLILVCCSSVSSWIEDNLISSSGFAGRISLHLKLRELPINVCKYFWGENRARVADVEILKMLGITGGVPRYLEEINPKESAEHNINRLCFNQGAFLFDEFDRLFSELFTRKAPGVKSIVSLLAAGPLTYAQIAQKRGLSERDGEVVTSGGGSLSKQLSTLAACGFVAKDQSWNFTSGEELKISRYRLSDNYLRFYLKFMARFKSRIQTGRFPHQFLGALPGWDSIMGLQFENTVLASRSLIFALLDLPMDSVINDGPYYQTATKDRTGCQIDYIIQSRFNTLYLCEIKFSRNAIGAGVIADVKKKIERLVVPKNFSIRPVLIHANEPEGISRKIVESRFFDRIIGSNELLREIGLQE